MIKEKIQSKRSKISEELQTLNIYNNRSSMMSEVNNFKRKRPVIDNPNGYYTPSDSETDEDDRDKLIQPKIFRRQSTENEQWQIAHIDGDESSDSISSNDQSNHGNNQLFYAALQKIHELETELAELNEVDHDSGHHDDDDNIDRGNSSEIEEDPIQLHDHREAILDDQPEALGFALCVKETFEYLAAEGITQDNAIITSLRERFLGQCNQ